MTEKQIMDIFLTLDENPLKEILSEEYVSNLLGVKKQVLARWRREKQLPFCQVSQNYKFYLKEDIIKFVKSKRMILDAVESEEGEEE